MLSGRKLASKYIASFRDPSSPILLEKTNSWGRIYYMDLKRDLFVHFTTERLLASILKTKTLMQRPTASITRSGADGIYAVSMVWGEYVPRTQLTHLQTLTRKREEEGGIVAVIFTTANPPDIGFPEEVIWHSNDVRMSWFKVMPVSKVISVLRSTKHSLPDNIDYSVTYRKGLQYANEYHQEQLREKGDFSRFIPYQD